MKRPIKDNERPWEDEGYLEDLENYIDHLEAKLKLLDIPIVDYQRELLIDFCERNGMHSKDEPIKLEQIVDGYLEGNS